MELQIRSADEPMTICTRSLIPLPTISADSFAFSLQMRRERMWLPVERKLAFTGLVSSCIWVAFLFSLLLSDGQLVCIKRSYLAGIFDYCP